MRRCWPLTIGHENWFEEMLTIGHRSRKLIWRPCSSLNLTEPSLLCGCFGTNEMFNNFFRLYPFYTLPCMVPKFHHWTQSNFVWLSEHLNLKFNITCILQYCICIMYFYCPASQNATKIPLTKLLHYYQRMWLWLSLSFLLSKIMWLNVYYCII